eukprot:s3427_g10.t1
MLWARHRCLRSFARRCQKHLANSSMPLLFHYIILATSFSLRLSCFGKDLTSLRLQTTTSDVQALLTLGQAFVTFEDDSAAQDAALWLRSQKLRGASVKCGMKSQLSLRNFFPMTPSSGRDFSAGAQFSNLWCSLCCRLDCGKGMGCGGDGGTSRGSRVGRAHSRGRWNVLEHTNTDFRRGGFVTHTSPKLDNAMPRRFSNTYFAKTLATDTFRETPRYSPSPSPRRGLFDSPGASPRAMRRCMSERGLIKRQDKPVSLFNRDEPFWTSPRTPRSWKADPPGSAARGRSAETLLPFKMRELSPRDTLQEKHAGLGIVNKKGMQDDQNPLFFLGLLPAARAVQDRPPAGRSKSPNFDVSEDWM